MTFADDFVLLVNSEENLQTLVDKIHDASKDLDSPSTWQNLRVRLLTRPPPKH